MSIITPTYAVNRSKTNAQAFPSCFALFHRDDVDAGALSIPSRCGSNISLTLDGALAKDASGLYNLTGIALGQTLVGDLPDPTDLGCTFVAVATIVHSQTASGTAGANTTFGGSTAFGLSHQAVGYDAAGAVYNTTPALSGSLLANTFQANIALVDIASGAGADGNRFSRTVAYSTFMNSRTPDVVYGEGDSISNVAVPLGNFLNRFSTQTLQGTTDDGRRLILAGLFGFAKRPTKGELLVAACEMITTGEVYSGWANRVQA